MLPGPILTVLTRVSRYQVQSKTSLHLTSRLPRAWHLPFCRKNECAVFPGATVGKNMYPSLGGSPFKYHVLCVLFCLLCDMSHVPSEAWGRGCGRFSLVGLARGGAPGARSAGARPVQLRPHPGHVLLRPRHPSRRGGVHNLFMDFMIISCRLGSVSVFAAWLF